MTTSSATRGKDTIDGGNGDDTTPSRAAATATTAILGGLGQRPIYGGDGNDKINGGNGNDVIYGDAGNDTIDGGDGNDYIDGDYRHYVGHGGLHYDRLTRGRQWQRHHLRRREHGDSSTGDGGNDKIAGGARQRPHLRRWRQRHDRRR